MRKWRRNNLTQNTHRKVHTCVLRDFPLCVCAKDSIHHVCNIFAEAHAWRKHQRPFCKTNKNPIKAQNNVNNRPNIQILLFFFHSISNWYFWSKKSLKQKWLNEHLLMHVLTLLKFNILIMSVRWRHQHNTLPLRTTKSLCVVFLCYIVTIAFPKKMTGSQLHIAFYMWCEFRVCEAEKTTFQEQKRPCAVECAEQLVCR